MVNPLSAFPYVRVLTSGRSQINWRGLRSAAGPAHQSPSEQNSIWQPEQPIAVFPR